MAEISGVGESSTIDRYDAAVEKEPKNIEDAQQEAQPQALPGESEKKLKASEDMHRALSPNLRNLDREQEIQAQLKVAGLPDQFLLCSELLKIKLKALEAEGYSIKEVVQEVHEAMKKGVPVEEIFQLDHELKKEILMIYYYLLGIADMVQKYDRTPAYITPFLRLYELERETGFVLFSTLHLGEECEALFGIYIKNVGIIVETGVDIMGANKFYRDVLSPNILKIFQYLEENGKEELIKIWMDLLVQTMFLDLIGRKESPSIGKTTDSIIQFLPYIVKYSTLEKTSEVFNEQHEDLPEIDKAYLWMDLNCQAAEILASIDPNKSQEYLEKAQKEKESKLWAYPFSTKRSVIEAKANEAANRIEAARLKCKESESLKAS